MSSPSRLDLFQAAVDERFGFLLERGFTITRRTSFWDRYREIEWSDGLTVLMIAWETFSGELDARIDGGSLWPFVVDAGLWDAGRGRVYQGYPVAVMEHGLDRIVALLRMRPELLMLPRLLDFARKTQRSELSAIEGSRLIDALRWESGEPENEVLVPFAGVASESDDLVVGDRRLWAQSYLDEIGIAEDCAALLAVFEPKLRELRGSA